MTFNSGFKGLKGRTFDEESLKSLELKFRSLFGDLV